jgi:hypothetical protein
MVPKFKYEKTNISINVSKNNLETISIWWWLLFFFYFHLLVAVVVVVVGK